MDRPFIICHMVTSLDGSGEPSFTLEEAKKLEHCGVRLIYSKNRE